jgi:hypothetical protein
MDNKENEQIVKESYKNFKRFEEVLKETCKETGITEKQGIKFIDIFTKYYEEN